MDFLNRFRKLIYEIWFDTKYLLVLVVVFKIYMQLRQLSD